jgi:hypothetical protein
MRQRPSSVGIAEDLVCIWLLDEIVFVWLKAAALSRPIIFGRPASQPKPLHYSVSLVRLLSSEFTCQIGSALFQPELGTPFFGRTVLAPCSER